MAEDPVSTAPTAPTYLDRLSYIRTCSWATLTQECDQILPKELMPQAFIAGLSRADSTIALRACLICWTATEAHMVPREMQLRSILADRKGQNSLVSAGTGSGKTLPIAVNILLDDPDEKTISLTVLPLKRLQVTQDDDFNGAFKLKTVIINEDTPLDESWWSNNIYHPRGTTEPVRHIIVTVEQLFKSAAGHMPRLGDWLRNKQGFQKLVVRINIDEGHFMYTAGLPLYGTSAFRPAWGQLDHLKRQLPRRLRWHVFSATFPRHILNHIESTLLGTDYTYICVTSNRPNIIYATHQVEGRVEDVENYESFLVSPFDLQKQPHVLIFVDNTNLIGSIRRHLISLLPPELRNAGIIQQYYSTMSESFLEGSHDAFVATTGRCRILLATSGQSVGVDFPDVKIVCTVGFPSSVVDVLQRAGRAVRTGGLPALFVIFYESWVHNIDLAEYSMKASAFNHDPDRPRDCITSKSDRKERAPLSLVSLVQSTTCLRELYAQYLGDQSPEALKYTNIYCCDRHESDADGAVFLLDNYLPSPVYVKPTMAMVAAQPGPSEPNKVKYRPTATRGDLDSLVDDWLKNKVLADAQVCGRPSWRILTANAQHLVVRIHPNDLTSKEVITRVLNESKDWETEFADELYQLIKAFDENLSNSKKASSSAKRSAAQVNRHEVRIAAEIATAAVDPFVVTTQDEFAAGQSTSTRKAGGRKTKKPRVSD